MTIVAQGTGQRRGGAGGVNLEAGGKHEESPGVQTHACHTEDLGQWSDVDQGQSGISAVSRTDRQEWSKGTLTVHAQEEIKSTAGLRGRRASGGKITKSGDGGRYSGMTE